MIAIQEIRLRVFASVFSYLLTGEALYKHLDRIIPALIGSLQDTSDEATWKAAEGRLVSPVRLTTSLSLYPKF